MEQNQNQITDSTVTASTGQIEGKEIAIIAYLTIIGLIAAFIMNNDKRAPFA